MVASPLWKVEYGLVVVEYPLSLDLRLSKRLRLARFPFDVEREPLRPPFVDDVRLLPRPVVSSFLEGRGK